MSAHTAARERPIIMSGESVRAILDERKTQTRRVVVPQPERRGTCGPSFHSEPAWHWTSPRYDNGDGVRYLHTDEMSARRLMLRACPFGAVGDRLWVRERWAIDQCGARVPLTLETWPEGWPVKRLVYAADVGDAYLWSRRSPRFMPRWASRLTLEITNVRVERVQDISGEDILAEGVVCPTCANSGWKRVGDTIGDNCECTRDDGGSLYRALWDSLNEKRGYDWNVNPWVWVIEFRVLSPFASARRERDT